MLLVACLTANSDKWLARRVQWIGYIYGVHDGTRQQKPPNGRPLSHDGGGGVLETLGEDGSPADRFFTKFCGQTKVRHGAGVMNKCTVVRVLVL